MRRDRDGGHTRALGIRDAAWRLGPLLALAAALFCVLANGFFVAAEFALARVRPTALETLAMRGDPRAARALEATRQLDSYLTATQFGITLASLALGWLGEPAIAHFLRPPLSQLGLAESGVHGVATAVAFTVISFLHIVLGELAPKSLAILRPEQTARMTAGLMHGFFVLMYPILSLLNGLSAYVLRRAGVSDSVSESEAVLSAEELRLVVQSSFAGDEARTKRDLLERVLRATDRPVRALMIPRVDMHILSLGDTFESWMAAIRRSGFSRYPVSADGDPDHVLGYVYVKDLLLSEGVPRRGIQAFKRDVLFVPESCSVGELLGRFQQTSIPMGIVVDEYGGTEGLVTVEDVVEELVGELHDELDTEAPRIEAREDGSFLVDGMLPVGDLPIAGLDGAEHSSGDTVSGYVIAQLGRLAHPGDRIRIGQYEVTVEDVRRRRIGRVALRPRPETMPPPSATSEEG